MVLLECKILLAFDTHTMVLSSLIQLCLPLDSWHLNEMTKTDENDKNYQVWFCFHFNHESYISSNEENKKVTTLCPVWGQCPVFADHALNNLWPSTFDELKKILVFARCFFDLIDLLLWVIVRVSEQEKKKKPVYRNQRSLSYLWIIQKVKLS